MVDAATREAAEAQLAVMATQFRPEALRIGADRMMALLNPDGQFSDADQARRRGLTIGPQGFDGMSAISGLLDPGTRAYLDAPPQSWVRITDLPVTVVVTTTLKELEDGAGIAITGSGTRLPIRDLIRMAAHAHHYLAIFNDNGRPLYLGRSKRIASPEQRLVLHARDRGCTHPGCHVPGYLRQVHHITDWAHDRPTDIDNLTFACGPHHHLLGHGWTTRKHPNGTTEWIPPPQLTLGEGRQLTPSY